MGSYLWLAFFTQHNVCKVCPCCSINRNFTLFYVWIIFHHINVPHFIYPFISWWIFGLFPILAFINCAAMNIHKYFYADICFQFSRSRVAGSYGNLCLSFWGPTKLFSTMNMPFYNPTNNVWFSIFFESFLIPPFPLVHTANQSSTSCQFNILSISQNCLLPSSPNSTVCHLNNQTQKATGPE